MNKDGDEIDFRKLAKEFDSAVEADNKYSRENAAKFRAVEQRVGSYEEFRDIVLASSLKPLDRKDIMGETKRHQPLNSLCSSKETSKRTTVDVNTGKFVEEKSLPQPQSADEFMKNWKNFLKEESSRYNYIMQIESSMLEKVFSSEQVGNSLGEIIYILERYCSSTDFCKIIEILKFLRMSKRFSISLQFLSKAEKHLLAKLFEKIKKTEDTEQQIIISQLEKDFMPNKY